VRYKLDRLPITNYQITDPRDVPHITEKGYISFVNGAITLIVLLIAPLGLAAVIINTLLIAAATFVAGEISDRIIRYLCRNSLFPARGLKLKSCH
jgi:hypothetical protein